MNTFTLVFVLALAVATGTRLWLARRHVRHIRAHRDRVPEPFAYQIDLASHQKAADYSVAKTRLNSIGIVVDAALLLLFTVGGLFAAIDAWTAGMLGSGIVAGVAFIACVSLVHTIVELPLSAYRIFGVETRFGFNKMSVGLFVSDFLKQLALSAIIGLPLVAGLLWVMGATGQWWWLLAWAAVVAFFVFFQAIYPTFIAPLFNKFSPLTDDQLRARIEGLLRNCGFKAQGLFMIDGSKRSTHGNAYFAGLGKSKRIALFDTLIARLSHGEIEAVLAHELGHFKLRHVLWSVVLVAAMSFVFFLALYLLRDAPWFFHGLNVRAPASDAVALTLFYTVIPVFVFFLRPLLSAYSRKNEFEADAYAAEHASGAALAQALVKLYKDNASTLTPDPLHSAFYDSHPPAAARIERLKRLAPA
jgi:STE24 endopeptidase